MQLEKIGFGAIRAGAVRKGMILEKLDGKEAGTQREILQTSLANRATSKRIGIHYKMLGGKQAGKDFWVFPFLNKMLTDFELVGWAKKEKPKKIIS